MQLYRKFSGPRLDVFRIDMRSYRGRNGANRQARRWTGDRALNPATEWLKGAPEIEGHRKMIAADMPIGVVVYDDWRSKTAAWKPPTAMTGPPLGRVSWRSLTCLLHRARGHPQRELDHWRRALRRHPSLRSHRAASAISRRSTSSSRVHCAGGLGPTFDRTFGPEVIFRSCPAWLFDLAPQSFSVISAT